MVKTFIIFKKYIAIIQLSRVVIFIHTNYIADAFEHKQFKGENYFIHQTDKTLFSDHGYI